MPLNQYKAALQNLLYYNAWDVALTYLLHCKLSNREPLPIYESLPFQYHPECMQLCLPKPRQPRTSIPRKATGRIVDYWEERKRNPASTLHGAEICITGDLEKIEREDAEALIEQLGGIPKPSVVRTLDFLIVGDTREFGRTSKMEKAEELIAKGAHTRIISEQDFWELVEKTQQSPTK